MSQVKERSRAQDFSSTANDTKEPSSIFGTAANAVTDTAKTVGNAIAGAAGQATDKAQEWASATGDAVVHATGKARDWAVSASDTAQNLGKDATDLIRRYPVAALCVGLGIGILIGKLTASHTGARR